MRRVTRGTGNRKEKREERVEEEAGTRRISTGENTRQPKNKKKALIINAKVTFKLLLKRIRIWENVGSNNYINVVATL